MIGRSHLDKALQEGIAAADDATATEDACPYSTRLQAMTRNAWIKGFRQVRAKA
jgi:ribosome modulation factor